jgi:cyanoexosortase B-associated protein
MIFFDKHLKEFPQIAALVLLLLLLAFGTVPGYLVGRWQWQQPQPPATMKQLRQLRQQGLTIPGWQNMKQEEMQIGGRKWSMQVVKKENSQQEAILLLLPQKDPKDQPQVEWTELNGWWSDIYGWQRWDVAQFRSAEFSVTPQGATNSENKVQARFFRAATKTQTFAVLQWYAMPNGGDPSPWRWFFSDQLAQWGKKRTPWVGVTILLPMEPLGKVETTWDEVQSIGKAVQTALMSSSL